MPIARPDSRAYRAVAWLVRHLMFSLCRYDWRGGEHLQQPGGVIAAGNHVTELDALSFAHFLFDQGVEPRILAKKALFDSPIGFALRATRMIPVDRGSVGAARSLEAAGEQLQRGDCVAILPEGTLTRDPDLWPMVGKTGLARIALATRLPVVPIAQWGVTEIMPRYGHVLKPFPRKKVWVWAGPPVDLSDLYDRPTDTAVLREATTRVMDAITALLEEIRGEKAPEHRFDLRLHPEYEKKQTVYPPVERP
ncbi:lysophospholipid acyltransferase family protein [Antribacter gilvus]|uniref:lysophospholipid acyltransferase family protein n=1 Tax=Antribacter gilvus TaxID=2304675 RepID=UPI000F7AA359|nr:lysophospholipid acyltransferase family protein [Antribacter gilvus]